MDTDEIKDSISDIKYQIADIKTNECRSPEMNEESVESV